MQQKPRYENFRGKRKRVILRLCYNLLGLDCTAKLMNSRGSTIGEKGRKGKQRSDNRSRKIHLGDVGEVLGGRG